MNALTGLRPFSLVLAYLNLAYFGIEFAVTLAIVFAMPLAIPLILWRSLRPKSLDAGRIGASVN